MVKLALWHVVAGVVAVLADEANFDVFVVATFVAVVVGGVAGIVVAVAAVVVAVAEVLVGKKQRSVVALVDVTGFVGCTDPGVVVDTEVVAAAVGLPVADRGG